MKTTCALFLGLTGLLMWAQPRGQVNWKHLSTANGDLPVPNQGNEQTSAAVFDIDGDGVNDFVITERTAAPAVVWYRRGAKGWSRYVVEAGPLHIEAGTTFADIDGDGDLDLVCGGDWKSNEIWWWENPKPGFDPNTPWKRHLIKNTGGAKHHDETFADVLGTGKPQLLFWNQDSHKLMLAPIPNDPRHSGPWPLTEIYSYSTGSQPEQRGKAASFKGVNEHEGIATGDVDGDGKLDIAGGGRFFRNLGNGHFEAQAVDPGYAFSRCAVGHLKKGKQAQIVMVIGDGDGPLMWYERSRARWAAHKIADIHQGHTLQLVDFNHDGNLDIFCAEQRLKGTNPDSKIYFFLGDGKGDFTPSVAATGYDSHESRVADLDGNGTLDLLIKPYDWQAPRLDIFLNLGPKK
ncbi:MAG TPA: VCBS repeat-containing protein [Bryobacteraceae bacterium]|nr:VCBS repeat-containing protein [Bryobacteraceae bacterium]